MDSKFVVVAFAILTALTCPGFICWGDNSFEGKLIKCFLAGHPNWESLGSCLPNPLYRSVADGQRHTSVPEKQTLSTGFRHGSRSCEFDGGKQRALQNHSSNGGALKIRRSFTIYNGIRRSNDIRKLEKDIKLEEFGKGK
uniref:Secreted protein n=1 Tax=Globodera pallida TaxID=36090 RepID=A0A183BIE6_GLOPA